MQHALAEIEAREEPLDRLRRGHLHHVLRVRQERAVHRERHGHQHALIFRHAIADEHVLERFLRGRGPAEQVPHVANRHRVVVLDAEGAGIVERAVADEEERRQPVGRRDDERFHAVHPAGAAAARERSRADRGRVLDDLELGVLAVGDDVFGVELSVGDDLRQRVHHFGVRTDRIRGDDVDVGQPNALRDRLAAVQQVLPLPRTGRRRHRSATATTAPIGKVLKVLKVRKVLRVPGSSILGP